MAQHVAEREAVVGEFDVLVAGALDQGEQLVALVAPYVAHGAVRVAELRLMSGHRDQQLAAGAKARRPLRQDAVIVGDVLEHLEGEQVLHGRLGDVLVAVDDPGRRAEALTEELTRGVTEIGRGDVEPTVDELAGDVSGAGADLEDGAGRPLGRHVVDAGEAQEVARRRHPVVGVLVVIGHVRPPRPRCR